MEEYKLVKAGYEDMSRSPSTEVRELQRTNDFKDKRIEEVSIYTYTRVVESFSSLGSKSVVYSFQSILYAITMWGWLYQDV
jgi:hypothetical protein